jgi:hypothetical protein
MTTDFEIKAAKRNLLFNKEDMIRYLKTLLEEATDSKEKIVYEDELDRLSKREIKPIHEDLEKDIVHCYIFDASEGMFYECDACDFTFEYDNNMHDLYLSYFTFKNEIAIV